MKIAFRKKKLTIAGLPGFCWLLELRSPSRILLDDLFIPELFFDTFLVIEGRLSVGTRELTRQFIKTIHTRNLHLNLSSGNGKKPGKLRLMGLRLPLSFADLFEMGPFPGDEFLEVRWIRDDVPDLQTFTRQVTSVLENRVTKKTPPALLNHDLTPTRALAAYSPRHQRRLVKSRYGVSLKEMEAIRGLHAFLGRTCDFTTEYPRIIEYVDTEAFYDQPHLNRKFKQMTGLSPLEYFENGGLIQENLMAVSYNEF